MGLLYDWLSPILGPLLLPGWAAWNNSVTKNETLGRISSLRLGPQEGHGHAIHVFRKDVASSALSMRQEGWWAAAREDY